MMFELRHTSSAPPAANSRPKLRINKTYAISIVWLNKRERHKVLASGKLEQMITHVERDRDVFVSKTLQDRVSVRPFHHPGGDPGCRGSTATK